MVDSAMRAAQLFVLFGGCMHFVLCYLQLTGIDRNSRFSCTMALNSSQDESMGRELVGSLNKAWKARSICHC